MQQTLKVDINPVSSAEEKTVLSASYPQFTPWLTLACWKELKGWTCLCFYHHCGFILVPKKHAWQALVHVKRTSYTVKRDKHWKPQYTVYCPKITSECNINQKIVILINHKYFTSVSIQHAHNMPSQLGISTEVKESVGLIKHTQFSNKVNLDLFSSRWHLNAQENPLCTLLKTLRGFSSGAFSRVQCVSD